MAVPVSGRRSLSERCFEESRDARGIRGRVLRERACVPASATYHSVARCRSARGRSGRSCARPLRPTRSAAPGRARRPTTSFSGAGSDSPDASSVARIVNHVTETNTGPIPSGASSVSPSVEAPAPSAMTAASGTPPAAARSDSSAPIERPRAAIRRGSTPGWRAQEGDRAGEVLGALPPERVGLAGASPVTARVVREHAVPGGVEHPHVRDDIHPGVVRAVAGRLAHVVVGRRRGQGLARPYYFMGKDNIVFHSVIWPACSAATPVRARATASPASWAGSTCPPRWSPAST